MLVALMIVFWVTLFYAPHVGGVIEWSMVFELLLYLLTFVYDLCMARVRVGGE
ncbi:hypothetical protein OG21DRAFT_1568365, partial [Imleria badia]